MSLGLVGKKIGMTRVFTEDGVSQPVTVIEVLPNKITQIRTQATDGYDGLQVTTGVRRAHRVSAAMKGHFAKAGVEPGRGVWEFRLNAAAETQPGTELTVGLFEEGQKVDVSGQTIGKGFAGVIKRHGFRGGRATHGNSKAHRLGGSIGNAQDPGRVFKGKKMAGHMGASQASQQNLNIVRVDSERNLILVAGSIPGSKGADLLIRPAIKSKYLLTIPSGNPEAIVEETQVEDTQVDTADTATEA
jgi:large subunit ribosomal protein L3